MPWDLLVDRADLTRTELVDVPAPDPGPGQVLLKVDRVGMTANNVTYAVFGDAMHYWDFFPAESPWGRVPLWGFGVVERSRAEGVEEGTRLYGYLPTSSHLLVEPAGVSERGFRDASAHRQHLPSPYNGLTTTTHDPAYDAAQEDLQVLYRPLFMTSFVLADFLTDNGLFGGSAVVLSSASSKTAYGAAFLLQGQARTVGLTSEGNRAFTESLGCYDEVLSYDEVDRLAPGPTVFVDVAGNAGVRRAVHEHLRDALVHSAVVGAAHHSAEADSGPQLPGARPAFFFAPDQMRKRYADWGPDGVEQRHAEAWRRFAPVVEGWVDVVLGVGPEALRADWLETLAGQTKPRTGHVVQL
jgi:NADPH:quinone reductase-like Zn-dependent oxidoreductase